jgi:hypothetical protein
MPIYSNEDLKMVTDAFRGQGYKEGYLQGSKDGQLKVLSGLERFLDSTKSYSKADVLSTLSAWVLTWRIEVEKQNI